MGKIHIESYDDNEKKLYKCKICKTEIGIINNLEVDGIKSAYGDCIEFKEVLNSLRTGERRYGSYDKYSTCIIYDDDSFIERGVSETLRCVKCYKEIGWIYDAEDSIKYIIRKKDIILN